MDDLDIEYDEPILHLSVLWHPIASQYSLHALLSRKGAKERSSLCHIDYYVGRMAPNRALARAVARECDDLRAIREGERATLPF